LAMEVFFWIGLFTTVAAVGGFIVGAIQGFFGLGQWRKLRK